MSNYTEIFSTNIPWTAMTGKKMEPYPVQTVLVVKKPRVKHMPEVD